MTIKAKIGKTGFLSILLVLSVFLFLNVLLSSFKMELLKLPVTEVIKNNFLTDIKGLIIRSESLKSTLELYRQKQATHVQVKESFMELKRAYKRTEYLLEYLDPELAKQLNGPPIPKVVVERQPYLALNNTVPVFTTYPPQGLQVVEELLFTEELNQQIAGEALSLVFHFEDRVKLFANSLNHQSLTDKQLIESLREQVIRAITLGVTGFDIPAAEPDLELTAISLEPVVKVLDLYHEDEGSDLVRSEITKGRELVRRSILYLKEHNDFNQFDRLYFIREFADPAYGALSRLQHLHGNADNKKQDYSEAVNDKAHSLFSKAFLQPAFYAKQDQANLNPELVQLGKFLFFDPVISSNNKRSCASCHNPSMAFADGLSKSLAFDFKGNTRRNSPSLINAVFSTAYFWDSRVQYLQDQVPDVLNQKDELHGTYEDVVEKLNQSREYRRLFKKAFKAKDDKSVSINTINRAIAAYVQSLVAFNSPFDQYMRRETNDYSEAAIRGGNLFMGKAGCATCHFAPVFNGTVPPRYQESETEVLGVPATADFKNPILDPDSGRAGVIPAEAFLHSFKTPTVRNAALTAPYMHNGAISTLEEVVEFYELGGGAGIGLEVPNQTLPSDQLELSEEEKQDLVIFIKSLSDTSSTTSMPEQLPSFPKGSPLNERKVGGEY